MSDDLLFDAGEVRRARYTIFANIAACVGWLVLNAAAAWWLRQLRLLGLSAAALVMILCWIPALRDLNRGRVIRGVKTYVLSGLVLLFAMGLSVPEMSLLFVFATFIMLAFGLSYAGSAASSLIVASTMLTAGALLFTSQWLGMTSGVDPAFLQWANVTGMIMALAINATSFISLHKTLQVRRSRLAGAEERYRALLENARDAIGILTPDGVILEANRGWEDVLGLPRDKLIGRNMDDFAAKPRTPPSSESNQSGGTPISGWQEALAPWWAVSRSDGKVLNVELSRTTVAVGGQELVLCVGRDVTERLRLESQLRQSQKMEAVGRLAGGIAHDFNNILSVILSHGDFILADLPSDSPSRGDVEQITQAATRASDLTRQLLMFSRQQVIAPKVLDLNDILESMDKMLGRILGEDIQLVSLLTPGLGRVRVDRGSVEQVIMNLVVNARDAMPTGGRLTIETANVQLDQAYAVDHLGAVPGPHVMLAVTDNGVGMDEATRARIFEPFFTTKARGQGTGLGLSTVFGIVEQSGGSVWVYSEVGRGATFKVYLPRVDAPVEPLSPTPAVGSGRGAETVLVVDDDEPVRTAACGILRRNGYQVIEARTPGEAVQAAEHHPGAIHLLLTDVVMPGVSGPDLAKQITKLRPDIKVICMSGYTDDSIVRHGVLQSEIAYLQKPLSPASLTAKVRAVLQD